MSQRWLSYAFTRGKPRSPLVDPTTLILDISDNGAGVRALPLEGGVNFRDLGGYQTADGRHVKWGRVFRAGELAGLTDTDLALLQTLGLKRIFDLRSAEEMAAAPDRIPQGAEYQAMTVEAETSTLRRLWMLVRYYHRLDHFLLDSYTRVMLERNALLFGKMFRQLADDNDLPAVFHCTAGKDRTGVTAALLLSTLGVPETTIISDYSLTNHAYTSIHRIISAQAKELARLGLTVDDMQPLLLANPETLRSTLNYIRERYGDVETYLMQRAELDAATLERLRTTLLE